MFHPTRVSLDAIEDEVFKAFPQWPTLDPPGAAGSTTTIQVSSASTVSPVSPPSQSSYHPKSSGHYWDAHKRFKKTVGDAFCDKHERDKIKAPVPFLTSNEQFLAI